MFSQRVKEVMDRKKFVKAPPTATVRKVAKLMAAKRVGAVLVVEDKRLVGIFTERDAMFRVIAAGLDPDTTPLSRVMTRSPQSISPKESFGRALLTMHQNGYRHLPVIENDVPVGIVSSRSAMDPELEEFVCERERRKHFTQNAAA